MHLHPTLTLHLAEERRRALQRTAIEARARQRARRDRQGRRRHRSRSG